MATSASTLNQEGEVTSVVEIEGTPLAAGDKEAAVKVAATDFQGFLRSQPRLQIRNYWHCCASMTSTSASS